MGATKGTLERSFRGAVRSGYNNAVAFLTLSLVGTIALLPLVTVGHAVFGVTYAVGVILVRGTPHSSREALGLFRDGVRRHTWAGSLLTVALLAMAAVLAGNVLLILSPGAGIPLIVAAVVSTLLLAAAAVVLLTAVALVACGTSVRDGLRDAFILASSSPGRTFLEGAIVASLFVLGVLTLATGWAVIGFAFTAGFVLLATAAAYEERAGENPMHALAER